MSASRETILDALQNLLAATGPYKLVSRRDRAPEQVGPGLSPALFIIDPGERYERPSPNLPPKRYLEVEAIFYNDVGPENLNLIPMTVVNNALDALDALLLPDDSAINRFTLGGLVYNCYVKGDIKKSTGAKTGKAGAIVPIEILIP
jgi:hypothetical protein